jgi:hypothetical protein
MFIPDPNIDFLPIPDLGAKKARILDPQNWLGGLGFIASKANCVP